MTTTSERERERETMDLSLVQVQVAVNLEVYNILAKHNYTQTFGRGASCEQGILSSCVAVQFVLVWLRERERERNG